MAGHSMSLGRGIVLSQVCHLSPAVLLTGRVVANQVPRYKGCLWRTAASEACCPLLGVMKRQHTGREQRAKAPPPSMSQRCGVLQRICWGRLRIARLVYLARCATSPSRSVGRDRATVPLTRSGSVGTAGS